MYRILLSCIIILYFTTNVTAQDLRNVQEYFNRGPGCKTSPDFEKDKKTGVVKLFLDGSDMARRHSNTVLRLMLKRFNCKVVRTDLFVIEEEMGCYNSFSIPYLENKYGKNVYEKTVKEAERMDRNGQGDSYAKLKVGQDSLMKNYFYVSIHPDTYENFLQSKYKGMSLYLFMYCDSTGKIYKTALSGHTSDALDDALKNAAKNVPYLVTPALENGQSAEGRVSLKVSFTKETKERYFESNDSKDW